MSTKIHREGYSRIVIDDKPLEDAKSPFLVDGIISSTLTLLYGAPKHGKSTLAATLAVAVANGTPFLGIPVNASGKVGIIAGDPGDDDQYAAMLIGRVPPNSVSSYAFARPPLPETWVQVRYELEREGTVLVIIDNLNAFIPGDINELRPVRAFYDMLDQFTRAGIAVVLIHHSTEKTGKGFSSNPQGHTAISGAARRKVYCVKPETGPLRLTFDGNYGPIHQMLVSRPNGRPEFEVEQVVTAGEFEERAQARQRKRSAARAERNGDIRTWIKANGATQRQAAEHFGLSVATINRAVK